MTSIQENNFQKPFLEKLNPVTQQKKRRPFSPVLRNTLVVKEGACDSDEWGVSVYNQKHSMILASPADNTVRFYDADTLLPVQERESLMLESSLDVICYSSEIDTYLLWCVGREVYTYNASSKKLEKLKHNVEASLLSITFINSTTYAFIPLSKVIFVKSLNYEEFVCFRPKNNAAYCLQILNKGRLLVAGLMDGSLVIYRTDRLPKLSMICSQQAHQVGKNVLCIEKARINQKEYMITCGNDGVISIWELRKGRMRRLRKIVVDGIISSLVFLEEDKMLAMVDEGYLKFIGLLSGRLEFKLDLQMASAGNLFFMKDKDAIGAPNIQGNVIKIVQLCENQEMKE